MTQHINDVAPATVPDLVPVRPVPDMGQGSREQSCRTQSFRGPGGVRLRITEGR